MSISDKLPEHKEEIQSALKCAICGENVLPNQPHQCKKEGEKNES